jgi:hypothetical protein
MAARNVIDPDVWWHLKTGEYIAAHKSIPRVDFFSYTRFNRTWIAHEWLAELGLYELQGHFGFGVLILTFAAAVATSLFCIYLRCGPAIYLAGAATVVAAWATAPVWGVRPQVLSFLLASLWLLVLDRSEDHPKFLWLTLPLILLWVNLHAGFAIGLIFSTIFLLGALVERTSAEQRIGSHHKYVRTASLVLLFDLLIVPLNPNGLRMFSYPIETLRSAPMQNYIAEWASPNFHRMEYWPFLIIVLGVLTTLALSRKPVRLHELILTLLTLYASLAAIRMIPFFVLLAVPFIAKRLADWPKSHARRLGLLQTTLNASIILCVASFAGVHVYQVIRQQPEMETRVFPAQAVVYLDKHPPAGPIFNSYNWGGYFIWKLYPPTRVFIDGRADLYGPEVLDDFADAYQLKASWEQVLRKWRIGTVIVPPNSPLAVYLKGAQGWKIFYQDSQALVFAMP